MFDTEFFPTPDHIIKIMLAPYSDQLCKGITILEPSAGKGDICDYINTKYCTYSSYDREVNKIYAIEQHPDLIPILHSKNYKVIDTDFLKYTGGYSFDLIAMNPPFSNGDDHLLKAWEILDEGNIVCLLNKETIDNPYTRSRQLLAEIIKSHGSTEYIGPAFKNAERSTPCEIVIVRLTKKPQSTRFNFFANIDREQKNDFTEENLNNQLMRADIFEGIVSAYEATKRTYLDHLKAEATHLYYDSLLFNRSFSSEKPVTVVDRNKNNVSMSIKDAYNYYTDELKLQAWNYVLNKTKIKEILTADVRKDFEKFNGTQGALDFTVKNINEFFDMLMMNKDAIMEKCILSVFDHMCSFDPKNKIHWEGWKTNDAYKVNKKVIMPRFVEYDEAWVNKGRDYTSKFRVCYTHRHGILHDIDKVMCYITGRKTDEISTIQDGLELSFERIGSVGKNAEYDNTCESEFFTMRFFKKGTLHIEFKDNFMWQEFNMRAAKNKKWLPAA